MPPALVKARRAPGAVGSFRVQFVALVILALAGGWLILVATEHGIGLEPDSQAYIAGARSLARGHGYGCPSPEGEYRPIIVWPPGYSLVLSVSGFVGVDPLAFARILAGLLFGANTFMVGWLIQREPTSGFWLPLFGSALILTSTDMLSIHVRALSEPLFTSTVLMGIIFMQRTIKEGPGALGYATAWSYGFSTITRFAGLAFIAAGAFSLGPQSGRSWRMRISKVALYLAVALAPFGAWVARNHLLAGSFAGRETAWHPPGTGRWATLGNALSCWVVPETSPIWARHLGLGFVVLILVATVVTLARKVVLLREPASLAPRLVIAAACYLGLLVFVMTLIDPRLAFERRIMAPLYPILTVAVLTALPLARVPHGPLYRGAVMALALGTLAWFGLRAGLWFSVVSADGQGLAGRRFKQSETLARARHDFAGSDCIYSNNVPAVYFHLGRTAYPVPRTWDEDQLRANTRFSEETRDLTERLAARHGIVVWLYDLPGRQDKQALRDLQENAPLSLLSSSADGVILGAPL